MAAWNIRPCHSLQRCTAQHSTAEWNAPRKSELTHARAHTRARRQVSYTTSPAEPQNSTGLPCLCKCRLQADTSAAYSFRIVEPPCPLSGCGWKRSTEACRSSVLGFCSHSSVCDPGNKARAPPPLGTSSKRPQTTKCLGGASRWASAFAASSVETERAARVA